MANAMSAALIDPRPPPMRPGTARTAPLRVCARSGCDTVIVVCRGKRFCSRLCAGTDHWAGDGTPNSPELIAAARRYWNQGFPTRAIAGLLEAEFNRPITKNVVIGIADRNDGFPQRPSPIKRALSPENRARVTNYNNEGLL